MKLLEYLPAFYANSPEMEDLQAAMQPEIDRLRAETESMMEQLCVRTATWGLVYWERGLGIPVDLAKPLDYRRSRVESKLRGQGTVTKAMIQNVAESFSNGQVDVLEYPAEFRFEVKFTGTIGIPPNMDDLSDALEEIKPAHLTYTYIILFRTWELLGQHTWGQLAAYTWRQLKEGEIQ